MDIITGGATTENHLETQRAGSSHAAGQPVKNGLWNAFQKHDPSTVFGGRHDRYLPASTQKADPIQKEIYANETGDQEEDGLLAKVAV